MNSEKKKLNPRSVKRKVLAGFFLAFLAILLALTITKYTFRDMMVTMEELSEPSEKLSALNQVFQEITTLDQLQRAEAIKNPEKPYNAFLNQSQLIISHLDSLSLLDWDTAQLKRIASMKEIVHQRDELFFEYLKLKSQLVNNKTLTRRIDTLSVIIEQKKIEIDTSVVTTQKKTTTTFTRDTTQESAKEDKNFFGKLFGKKKKDQPEETMHIKVQEELSVSVDTLAVAKHNKALEEVEKIFRNLEADQRTQSRKLLDRELELINANGLLITQLTSILHEVERDELFLMREKNTQVNALVAESISRISILLLVFFLGAALLVYLIWADISRSNFYKEQLEKARDEAEQLTKIKERFLANMSHEIRTPLQSILGFAEQIKSHQSVDTDAVEAIHSSSEHLLHIVNEVLDYSRISSGNFTFAKEPFSLFDVVKEIESAMQIQADRKRLTLLLDVEQATNYSLLGDAFRLRQILYNIVGNAVKFTNKGFVKLTVRTREEKDSQVYAEFEIMDTGIGIKPEDLNKIFNQFEQANTSIERHYGGTGLGLTIVKSLIEAQGGLLNVESESGVGSVFTVRLHFEKAKAAAVHEQHKLSVVSQQNVAGKVIVVDDDQMILKLCDLILQKYSVEHSIYHDPEKLLYADVDKAVTHILMDIRMPNINGVELCQALRKKYPPTTQFIALTAHVFPQDKKALHDNGFDVVLSKPFHEQEFLNILGINPNLHRDDTQKEVADFFDLSALREMTLHDEDLFRTVLQQFLEETQNDLKLLDEHISAKEKGPVREIVHKLAGRIGQIGILPLSLKLRDVENKIEEGKDLPHLTAQISKVKDEIKAVLKNIHRMNILTNHNPVPIRKVSNQ